MKTTGSCFIVCFFLWNNLIFTLEHERHQDFSCPSLHLSQEKLTYYSKQWKSYIDTLIGLLQTLLSKLESGFYIPQCEKTALAHWIRSSIKDLHATHKKMCTIITAERIATLYDSTKIYVLSIEEMLRRECSDFPIGSLGAIDPASDCCSEAVIETNGHTIFTALGLVEKLVDNCGLTAMHKMARRVEDLFDWLNIKTGFYSWYEI